MDNSMESFLMNLSPEKLAQCGRAIESYKQQYAEMLDGSKESEIYATKDVHECIDELVEDNLKTGEVSCKKGCNHCCHLCVYVSPDEITTIIDYCEKNGIEIDWDRANNQKDFTANNWFKRPLEESRCLFLKDGSCSIYPVRPMACRKYHVISEPHLCDTSTGAHRVAIVNNIDVELLVSSIHQLRTFGTLSQQILKHNSRRK